MARIQPAPPALLDARARGEAEATVGAAAAAVEQARAEADRAAAEAALAQAERERVRRLAAEEIVARDRLEAAETAARSRADTAAAARAAVARAREELAAARARLGRLDGPTAAGRAVEVAAPVDGVVLRRLRESEAVVAAGEPLLEIGDPGDLEAVVDLLSRDAVLVAPGDPVRLEEWGGERALAGRVRRVEPGGFTRVSALGVEEQRVDVIVAPAAPGAWAGLGDGFRVEVSIVVWQADDVLQVPVGALFRQPDGEWAVFAVDGDRARLRPVTVGRRNDERAQVLDGLRAGERVIVHPGDAVEEGARVRVRR